jgi:hypothetical protein
VREALLSLPSYLRTLTVIEGISATDIFTLNSALGATIEAQVVTTLNQMRNVWDPDAKYQIYSFVRQPQTFPDVLLRRADDAERAGDRIILGIEMKGWYLLAKEQEPSFRFTVTPAACAPADLIAVVPWVLSNVIAGSPRVLVPYIESARYAAEYRNYHWSALRDTDGSRKITQPAPVSPYPAKSNQIADVPEADGGGNFGRFARTGIMDTYRARVMQEPLCGISAEHWLAFFKVFREGKGEEKLRKALASLQSRIRQAPPTAEVSPLLQSAAAILDGLERLVTTGL